MESCGSLGSQFNPSQWVPDSERPYLIKGGEWYLRNTGYLCVLVRVSIAVKRHHDHGNSFKKNI